MKKSVVIIWLVSMAGLACKPEPKTSSEQKEWFPYVVVPTFQIAPDPKSSYLIDHRDPAVVDKTCHYPLGERTGFPAYDGKPLRAVFNDSYAFHTDRIISPDFLTVFKEKNGYDIAPYLGMVFQKGYKHPTLLAGRHKGAKPPFTFNPAKSWRLMHDYDLTVTNKSVGKRLFTPYQLDVTKYLEPGGNTLTVQVTTSRRNSFIGETVRENAKYVQFKEKENTLLPAGLTKSVRIQEIYRNS